VGIEGGHEPVGFDTTRTFVRVVERRPDGFVEFHFSIGEPSLFVEMLLTEAAFEEFCAVNRTELVGPESEGDAHWTMRDATHQRFK
jgi:phenol hydroxylase P0 protein